jgi:hypothetical protein
LGFEIEPMIEGWSGWIGGFSYFFSFFFAVGVLVGRRAGCLVWDPLWKTLSFLLINHHKSGCLPGWLLNNIFSPASNQVRSTLKFTTCSEQGNGQITWKMSAQLGIPVGSDI